MDDNLTNDSNISNNTNNTNNTNLSNGTPTPPLSATSSTTSLPTVSSTQSVQRKAHTLTGPIYVSPSRVEGMFNSIDGNLVLGSKSEKNYVLSILSNQTKIQSDEVDFSSAKVKNFGGKDDGDILIIKGGSVSKLSTENHVGDFLRVGQDGLPNYESIDALLESRERSLTSAEKSNNQKIFPQSLSAVMGWNIDSQGLFNDSQFDLATGRFIPLVSRRYRIEASVTFLNEGNSGWRTLMIRKNSTTSLTEHIAQSQSDTAIPQTLKVTVSFYATVGDFFEVVLSHTDTEPITVLSGPPTRIEIEKV